MGNFIKSKRDNSENNSRSTKKSDVDVNPVVGKSDIVTVSGDIRRCRLRMPHYHDMVSGIIAHLNLGYHVGKIHIPKSELFSAFGYLEGKDEFGNIEYFSVVYYQADTTPSILNC